MKNGQMNEEKSYKKLSAEEVAEIEKNAQKELNENKDYSEVPVTLDIRSAFSAEVYRRGYYYLFNQITDMIQKLQHIQEEAEDIFIESEDKGGVSDDDDDDEL